MYKKNLWYISIGIIVISLVIIFIGFIKAMNFTPKSAIIPNNSMLQGTSNSSKKNTESDSANATHILLMGDSIAKGTGDEKGKGIGGYLVDLFKSLTTKEIKVSNVAEDGYKIDDLRSQINSGKLDKDIKNANFLIISTGGSELQEIQNQKDSQKEQNFNEKQSIYMAELKEIVQKIRTLNKDTQIIVIGNYNPLTVDNTSDNVRYLHTWDYNTQLVLANDNKAVMISTYDLFKNNLNRFLAKDKVNPNTTGYQTIAYLISKSVENTLNK